MNLENLLKCSRPDWNDVDRTRAVVKLRNAGVDSAGHLMSLVQTGKLNDMMASRAERRFSAETVEALKAVWSMRDSLETDVLTQLEDEASSLESQITQSILKLATINQSVKEIRHQQPASCDRVRHKLGKSGFSTVANSNLHASPYQSKRLMATALAQKWGAAQIHDGTVDGNEPMDLVSTTTGCFKNSEPRQADDALSRTLDTRLASTLTLGSCPDISLRKQMEASPTLHRVSTDALPARNNEASPTLTHASATEASLTLTHGNSVRTTASASVLPSYKVSSAVPTNEAQNLPKRSLPLRSSTQPSRGQWTQDEESDVMPMDDYLDFLRKASQERGCEERKKEREQKPERREKSERHEKPRQEKKLKARDWKERTYTWKKENRNKIAGQTLRATGSVDSRPIDRAHLRHTGAYTIGDCGYMQPTGASRSLRIREGTARYFRNDAAASVRKGCKRQEKTNSSTFERTECGEHRGQQAGFSYSPDTDTEALGPGDIFRLFSQSKRDLEAEKARVLKAMLAIRRSPEYERSSQIKALVLQWHPDKHTEDKRPFATAIFQYLQEQRIKIGL